MWEIALGIAAGAGIVIVGLILLTALLAWISEL
jgi:hypothetical protein